MTDTKTGRQSVESSAEPEGTVPSPSSDALHEDSSSATGKIQEANARTLDDPNVEQGTSSSRSSIDFSFGSLHISAEDWESIDRETELMLTEATDTCLTDAHTGDSVHDVTSISTYLAAVSLSPPEQDQTLEPTVAQPASPPAAPVKSSTREPKRHKYKFSPSVLAHHANTACEKMLRLKGEQLWQESQVPKTNTGSSKPVKVPTEGPTTVTGATLARGIEFESRLQRTIQDRIDCEAEHDRDSFFRLATSQEGTTLCQPIFSLDRTFYTLEMRRAGIEFGRFIPDFIRILPGTIQPDGSRKKRLYIIDAKSSSQVKISHQFQVTLYAIFLDHLIKVNGQQHLLEIDPRGGVWIPIQSEPKVFSLAFMRPIAENFIFRELPAVLIKPQESVVWHIDDPCLQCEFLARCKNDAVKESTLSLLPLVTRKSAFWVKSLFKSSSRGKTEIEDLEDLVRDRASLSDMDQSSLAKVLWLDNEGDSPLLNSYRQRVLKVLPIRTMDLPRLHQDRLLVNIMTDPSSLLPFAYSLDMFKEQRDLPIRSTANAIAYSLPGGPFPRDDQVLLAQELIDTLYDWLQHVSEIQPRPPVLTIFFYSQSMRTDLSTLLTRVASSKSDSVWTTTARSRAVELLSNMFEDPNLLTLSETTGAGTRLPDLLQLTQGYKNFNPIVDKRLFVIETAIRQLLVLPVIGSYSFKDIMTYLVDKEIPYIIDKKDRDDDGYNTDAIYQRWANGSSMDEIKLVVGKWAKQQNIILIALYALLRQEFDDLTTVLLAPQAPFKMRTHLRIQQDILAQFGFFQQWEAITLATKRRQARLSQTRGEAMRHQHLFQCRFLGRHVGLLPGSESGTRTPKPPSNTPSSEYVGMFEITSRVDPGVLAGETFKRWILSPDTPSGQKDRIRFDELGALLRAFGRGSPAIVSVPYYDSGSKVAYISGAYNNMVDALGLTEGENYILERREFTPTLTTSMDKLVEMNQTCRIFIDLMTDPNKWGLKSPAQSADVFLESITGSVRQYDMTISQEQAFARVVNNRLQIIWGPPGSGKTHFLALTILRFVDILRSLSDKGKGQGPQTIVLTAFTHTAINNLVARVARLHEEIAPRTGNAHLVRPFLLCRLKAKGVTLVEPADLVKLQRGPQDEGDKDIVRVVCGTVWQIRRASNPKTGVDYMRNVQMLIIDEGSQLLAADAIHAVECLDPERGRLIIAGDHLQLGPVIMGAYPDSENAVDPTGSIMRNLMRKRNNTPVSLHWVEGPAAMDIGPCTSQLQENFRMNRQLGTFMKKIYGPNYQIQTPSKTLPYGGGLRGSSFPEEVRRVLDPDRSAICIELQLTEDKTCQEAIKVRSNSRAAAYLEAEFVAGVIVSYLEMVGKDTVTSLFVVVPHHTQRLSILNKLRLSELEKTYPLAQVKVDTIEKMQGQEADLVVVCFALFDDFTLVNELAFLYSVHRWIVALSRARCKTVLLVTPELKSPKIMGGSGKADPSELETLDGWGLVQAFERYAEELGGKFVWPINQDFLRSVGMQDV
ncbi:Tripartite DNA replication factor [Mortierella sp. GBA43]|nr:Tripartite DNA replication factor [Mortierella sp. GBA43]